MREETGVCSQGKVWGRGKRRGGRCEQGEGGEEGGVSKGKEERREV